MHLHVEAVGHFVVLKQKESAGHLLTINVKRFIVAERFVINKYLSTFDERSLEKQEEHR